MTAKEYLSQAAVLDSEINRKIDRLGDLEALVTKTTSVLRAMPGGGRDGGGAQLAAEETARAHTQREANRLNERNEGETEAYRSKERSA